MRRTRRRKYIWLPISGTSLSADGARSSISEFVLDVNTSGQQFGVQSVTYDQNQELASGQGALAADTPLAELIANEYFLKRIVGKCFVNTEYQPQVDFDIAGLPGVIVTAAFFIARQDSQFPNFPLDGALTPTIYNPQSAVVIREPWIWRRTWVLGLVGRLGLDYSVHPASHSGQAVSTAYPTTNVDYGSVADGPHIDARTARRVRQEERLWFVAGATTYPLNQAPNSPTDLTFQVRIGLDVRLLGALRKSRNRGSF